MKIDIEKVSIYISPQQRKRWMEFVGNLHEKNMKKAQIHAAVIELGMTYNETEIRKQIAKNIEANI